jgi:potassium-dependent mechanosensitive channel
VDIDFSNYADFFLNNPILKFGTETVSLTNIILSLLFLIISIKVKNRIDRYVSNKLAKDKYLENSFKDAIKKFIYYGLLIVIFFITLEIANVPLIAFTALGTIWNYTIITIDGGVIATSNIITAIIVFIIGWKIKKGLNNWVKYKLNKQHDLDQGFKQSIAQITHYIFIITIVLVSLKISNMPLTAFAFVGGALAIGIGFGSQNIINNFMSGLIIMFEQPIRVGDLIEFESQLGTVVNIGARCTQVNTHDNIDILIPNSTLLQSTINNLTLTDCGNVRIRINIQLPCGNPIKLIKEVVTRALDHSDHVLQNLDKGVYCIDTKDGFFYYEVLFWMDMLGPVGRRAIIDEVYQEIFKEFEKNNIRLSYWSYSMLEDVKIKKEGDDE